MAERLKTKLLESDKQVDLVAGPDAYRDLPNLISIVRVSFAHVHSPSALRGARNSATVFDCASFVGWARLQTQGVDFGLGWVGLFLALNISDWFLVVKFNTVGVA